MSDVSEESVRAEVRAWLEANWNPELGLVEWRNKLIDSGWGVPGWPKAPGSKSLVLPVVTRSTGMGPSLIFHFKNSPRT